jgi:hypothetical protein
VYDFDFGYRQDWEESLDYIRASSEIILLEEMLSFDDQDDVPRLLSRLRQDYSYSNDSTPAPLLACQDDSSDDKYLG